MAADFDGDEMPDPGRDDSHQPAPQDATSGCQPVPGRNDSRQPVPGRNDSHQPVPGRNDSHQPVVPAAIESGRVLAPDDNAAILLDAFAAVIGQWRMSARTEDLGHMTDLMKRLRSFHDGIEDIFVAAHADVHKTVDTLLRVEEARLNVIKRTMRQSRSRSPAVGDRRVIVSDQSRSRSRSRSLSRLIRRHVVKRNTSKMAIYCIKHTTDVRVINIYIDEQLAWTGRGSLKIGSARSNGEVCERLANGDECEDKTCYGLFHRKYPLWITVDELFDHIRTFRSCYNSSDESSRITRFHVMCVMHVLLRMMPNVFEFNDATFANVTRTHNIWRELTIFFVKRGRADMMGLAREIFDMLHCYFKMEHKPDRSV